MFFVMADEEALRAMATRHGQLMLRVVTAILAGGGALLLAGFVPTFAGGEECSVAKLALPIAGSNLAQPADRAEALPEGAVGRLGSGRLRIGNSAFALLPGGKQIIALSPEGLVRKFDANSGKLLEQLQITDRSMVYPACFAPAKLSRDGTLGTLFECSDGDFRDGAFYITILNIKTGKVINRYQTSPGVRSTNYQLAPDGKHLAFVEDLNRNPNPLTLWLYDFELGKRKKVGNPAEEGSRLDFSPDGKRIFLSSSTSIVCYDVEAQREAWTLPRSVRPVFASDSKAFVSDLYLPGPSTNDILQFVIVDIDPISGKPTETVKSYEGFKKDPNADFVIAPDNRTLVMNCHREIILYDFRANKVTRRFPMPDSHGDGYGPAMSEVSADGRTVLTNDGYLQRWDLKSGKGLFEPPSESGLGPVMYVAYNPEGTHLMSFSGRFTLTKWDTTTGKRTALKRLHPEALHFATTEGFRSVSKGFNDQFSPDLNINDSVAGKILRTIHFGPGQGTLHTFGLTANGKKLLTIHGPPDAKAPTSQVRSFDVASGRMLSHFDIKCTHEFSSPPFSPCGRWVVLNGKIYDAATGVEQFTPRTESNERLLPIRFGLSAKLWFSTDSRLLAGRLEQGNGQNYEAHALAVWELATGKVLARFPNTNWVDQVAISPDNCSISFADGAGIRTRDLLNGSLTASHTRNDVSGGMDQNPWLPTRSIVFSPDSSTLATGHLDGSIFFWRARADKLSVQRITTAADLKRPGPIWPANRRSLGGPR